MDQQQINELNSTINLPNGQPRPTLFEWDAMYSVKVDRLDGHHKRLFDLINKLHVAMLAREAKSVLAATLDELIAYTKMHFSAEENLLKSSGYPDLSAHMMEHDRFVRTVEEFQKHFESGQQFLSVQLMDFLKDWLCNHILRTDQKYSDFLAAKGAR